MIPTMRRATYAACLLATPALQEPIFLGSYLWFFKHIRDLIIIHTTQWTFNVHKKQSAASTVA